MGNYDFLLYVGVLASPSIAATTWLHYNPHEDAFHKLPVNVKKEPEKQSRQSHSDHFKHPDLGIIAFQRKDKSYFTFHNRHKLCFASLHPSESILQRLKRLKIHTLIPLIICHITSLFLLHQNLYNWNTDFFIHLTLLVSVKLQRSWQKNLSLKSLIYLLIADFLRIVIIFKA